MSFSTKDDSYDNDYELLRRDNDFSFLRSVRREPIGNNAFITTFEEKNDTQDHQDENDWWTEEELRRLVENKLVLTPSVGISGDDTRSEFARRMSIMLPIKSFDDGKPAVYKQILTPGYGEAVQADSTVSFHLTAFYEGGREPFDSTELRDKPFLTRLSNDLVLPGIYYALTSMKCGERSEFIVEPEMAFGTSGAPPRVPPNCRILYIIAVRRIHLDGTIENYLAMTDSELAALPFEKIVQLAESEKNIGNSFFKERKFEDAFRRYNRTINFLKSIPPFKIQSQFDEVKEIMLKLYTNGANVALKTERLHVASSFCESALNLQPGHLKASYFLAKANFLMGRLTESRSLLDKINFALPNQQEVLDLLFQVSKQEKADSKASKNLAERMGKAFNCNA